MKDLAPNIYRQRLLLEGYYNKGITEKTIRGYYKHICKELDLSPYAEPLISNSVGYGSQENQGYEAFQPLIESGISLYVWSNVNFISMILYTCKRFDEEFAINITKDYFSMVNYDSKIF